MMGGEYHPKHVEQFPDINNLCNVASCWIYIGILLAHTILHISRIRVNTSCYSGITSVVEAQLAKKHTIGPLIF
jgi:hypothetical protein